MLATRITNARLTERMPKTSLTSISVTMVALSLALYSQLSQAEPDKPFVDSVHAWGSWDLGLQPAAGGPVVIPNNTALRVEQRNIQFRPNDNNAFSASTLKTSGNNPTP